MRLIRLLKRFNWKVYFMELIIVIVGISIAYQVNVLNERRVNHRLEITAIENLQKELEINITELNSLNPYRKRITNSSRKLVALFNRNEKVSKDSLEKYLPFLLQTATPDLQHEATGFYLNSNYSNANVDLKNELLTLRTYFQELMEMSDGYKLQKRETFIAMLRSSMDFYSDKIENLDRLNSLEFRNVVWYQTTNELELNRLHNQALKKLTEVDSIVNKILGE